MKLYRYGTNFDPITNTEISEQIEIRIPAKSEEEAYAKLDSLIYRILPIECPFYLIDVEEY